MDLLDAPSLIAAELVAKRAPIDEAKVATYVGRFKSAARDKVALEAFLDTIGADRSLNSGDVIEIVHRITRGRRASSKPNAIRLLSDHCVELIRADAKMALAAKSRPL